MQYGFIVTVGTPREQGDLAHAAEQAGWDGVFTWDGVAVGGEVWDPWVIMSVFALRTERVRIGAMIVPPSRRRPWKLAREMLTIDHLSNGRLVLPVGLGALSDRAFEGVGEATDRKTRAELVDETLELLDRFWTGESVSFDGAHYHVDDVTIRPRPVQQPRIPVWVVAAWPRPKSMARALRYDGIVPNVIGPVTPGGQFPETTPDHVREIAAYGREHRPADAGPWQIIAEGVTPATDPAAAVAKVQPFADAGATWWIESMWDPPATVETLRARIAAGPPRPR